MDFNDIDPTSRASILVKDGMLVVDFTRNSYNNRHENVRLTPLPGGGIQVRSERQNWEFVGDLGEGLTAADLHPDNEERKEVTLVTRGWWWKRRQVREVYYPDDMVRLKDNTPRMYQSNHYTVIR